VSYHADESDDRDPLLDFDNEPKITPVNNADSAASRQPAEQMEVAAAPSMPVAIEAVDGLNERLDRLERALVTSVSQLSLLGSEFATLVGTIDDIRKTEGRSRPLMQPRRLSAPVFPHRAGSAVAAVLFGIAISVGAWTLWSPEPIDGRDAAPPTLPLETIAHSLQPAITFASIPTPTLAPARPPLRTSAPPDRPARSFAVRTAAERVPARTEYVGTLSIDSEPGGEVFINRQPAGHTPLRVANLKAGSHLIWIERDGYRRFTRVVQVPADRVSRVSASLESLATR
jgi:PEGA domain